MANSTNVSKDSKAELLNALNEQLRREARSDLVDFTYYTYPQYEANWHHDLIGREIDDFLADPDQKRMMLFVPPQHGKSELATVRGPAYVLGKYPHLKIACCSHNLDLARKFAKQVATIVASQEYGELFPGRKFNGAVTEFDQLGYAGGYKAVGVGGGLTGHRVDLAIIDDPIKDLVEASSPTYRERVWGWYTSVLRTRLHNASKVLLILTRWHEDDLAGRLLEKEPEKWKVVKIPAIKLPDDGSHPDDPREPGEALWEERHSLEKLGEERALSETVFQSLYQQNPSNPDGEKIKAAWFEYCDEKEVPGHVVRDLWVDGAYTKNTKNDPTGFMVAGYSKRTNRLYIFFASEGYLEMPEALERIDEYSRLHGLGPRSRVRFEPKASGKSMRQMIKRRNRRLSAVEIEGPLVAEGKEARCGVASPKIESGRVVIVRGAWNDKFVKQLIGYPKAAHDEFIDLMGYACDHHFDRVTPGARKRN